MNLKCMKIEATRVPEFPINQNFKVFAVPFL